MKISLKKGKGEMDAVIILAFLVFIWIVTPKEHFSTNSSKSIFEVPQTIDQSGAQNLKNTHLSFSTGNAPYTQEAYKEYITLSNWGSSPVNITGWQLRNGKDKRTYSTGDTLQQFSADIANIPRATKLLYRNGNGVEQDVILAPGERAIITTGYLGVRDPIKIKSFKENACTGYIGRLPGYNFEPSLDVSCPSPSKEPGLEAMSRECRDFVSTMSSCTTPVFDTRQYNGDTCTICINGVRLDNSCAAFIKQHFSYEGCLAFHSGDKDFDNKNTWRIFLNRAWEMWSDKYEVVNIFDRANNLIISEDY